MKTRFSIRDLLWLLVVFAVSFAWWFNNRQMAETIAHLRNSQSPVTLRDESVENAMRIDAAEF